MNENIVQGLLGMPRGSLLRIDGGAGVAVDIRQGELWITEEGDIKDHMVQAGQSFRIKSGGVVLAHAFRRSVIALTAAGSASPVRRIVLTRPGSAAPAVLHQHGRMSLGEMLRRLREAVLAPLFPPADVR